MPKASSGGPSLLVVEDDEDLGTSLVQYLESEGYEARLVEDGDSALDEVTRVPGYDLIVLDAKLPERSGFEVLRAARDDGVTTPVLMLTALEEHDHRMRGFQVGADDYLTKPFETTELLARIDALLRRASEVVEQGGVFEVGDVRVDLDRNTVVRDGTLLDLTELEFRLLAYLLRRRGRTATREQILRDVWDLPPGVETRTIDRHVNALRDKMGRDAEDGSPVRSVYGIGYKLEGAERVDDSVEPTA